MYGHIFYLSSSAATDHRSQRSDEPAKLVWHMLTITHNFFWPAFSRASVHVRLATSFCVKYTKYTRH